MARMVAAVFHRRRVLPLTQRRLRLDEMTPKASLEGSFKQEDIDRVPMRPTQGFEPLVSVIF
jgi:hypothetical protein